MSNLVQDDISPLNPSATTNPNTPHSQAEIVINPNNDEIASLPSPICGQCGFENQIGDIFCADCGWKLEQIPPQKFIQDITLIKGNFLPDTPQPLPANANLNNPFVLPIHKKYHFIASAATDTGILRDKNQDDYFMLQLATGHAKNAAPQIFMVADGMGGTVGGEIASAMTRDMLQNWSTKFITQMSIDQYDINTLSDELLICIQDINKAIIQKAQNDQTDMGTTLTGCVIINDTAYIVNVGDSRTYLIRNGDIRRLTTDHSLVQQLVNAGAIDIDEVYEHPNRNIIYSSLGDKENTLIDLFTEPLEAGDILIMCSDGLWEMVRDAQIKDIVVASQSPFDSCRKLVQQANTNGGEDNITAIVVFVY